jgi:hypothetical protein
VNRREHLNGELFELSRQEVGWITTGLIMLKERLKGKVLDSERAIAPIEELHAIFRSGVMGGGPTGEPEFTIAIVRREKAQ